MHFQQIQSLFTCCRLLTEGWKYAQKVKKEHATLRSFSASLVAYNNASVLETEQSLPIIRVSDALDNPENAYSRI